MSLIWLLDRLRALFRRRQPRPVQPWVRPGRQLRIVELCPRPAPSPAPAAVAPPPDPLQQVHLDPEKPRYTSRGEPGLVFQWAVVDVLLADDRMTRLGVYAGYDAATGEPRLLSYVPLHDLVVAQEVLT